MTRRPGSRPPLREGILLAASLLLTVSCSKRVAEPVPESAKVVEGARPAEAPAPALAERAAAPASPAPQAPRRMIVRTAQVRVVVADAAATASALTSLVESAGGFVSESKQWREGEQLRASLTFRVPVRQLNATLRAIRSAALRIESESVTGQDVTAEYVDLGAELANLEATEKELRELLGTVRQRTQKAADILEVFEQLTKIRGDIEKTRARMTTLSQLTELSTINVELVPDALARPISEERWRPLGTVRSAVRTLVSTVEWLVEALIWILLYVLPVLVVLAVPVLLVRAAVRAARRRRET